MKRFNTEKLLNRVQCNRDTVLKKTRYRKENSYLAYYGYGWYKMGMTNNPQRREKELNIYHFDSGARTKGEFVYIPSVDPEVVAMKYEELMTSTVKTLRKNTFNSVRKTNNVLRKQGHETIKADVSLTISK